MKFIAKFGFFAIVSLSLSPAIAAPTCRENLETVYLKSYEAGAIEYFLPRSGMNQAELSNLLEKTSVTVAALIQQSVYSCLQQSGVTNIEDCTHAVVHYSVASKVLGAALTKEPGRGRPDLGQTIVDTYAEIIDRCILK